MSELVEKVARAIETASFKWKAENGGDDASFADVPECVQARAAISAVLEDMREPSREMILATRGYGGPAGIFPVMIDVYARENGIEVKS